MEVNRVAVVRWLAGKMSLESVSTSPKAKQAWNDIRLHGLDVLEVAIGTEAAYRCQHAAYVLARIDGFWDMTEEALAAWLGEWDSQQAAYEAEQG